MAQGSKKRIGVVWKVFWSTNCYRGFDRRLYDMWLFGKLNVGFKYVQEHGLGFEWWNFYEGFDKEYYYGYLPPLHKLKPSNLIDSGVVFQVSKNVFDGEWYLVGIYGGVEILPKGLSHGHIVWGSIPIKYRDKLSKETVNEVFSGNYFYVKARKEYSTPIPKPMPIDWREDFGTPVLRQAFFAYLDAEVALSVLDKTIEYVEELKEGKVGVTCFDINVASRRLRKLRKILKKYTDRDNVAITGHSIYYVRGPSRKEDVNRHVSYVGSRSKYDGYWLSMMDELRGAIKRAYVDGVVVIDVSDIVRYGERKPESWYGSVVVCRDGVRDKRVVMAHLRSLANILVKEGVLASYNVCFRFKMTRDRKLVVEKVLQCESVVGKRLVREGLTRYTGYRRSPSGASCVCDWLFKDMIWQELVMVKLSSLPRKPGVYVIRVVEKGKDVDTLIQEFRNTILGTGWLELIDYVYSRLERLYRIRGCPVIYIGSTDNIQSRYKDLAGRRHTAFFPILALLLGGWRLDYGYKTVTTKDQAQHLEEELKTKYRRIHGTLPPLVEK